MGTATSCVFWNSYISFATNFHLNFERTCIGFIYYYWILWYFIFIEFSYLWTLIFVYLDFFNWFSIMIHKFYPKELYLIFVLIVWILLLSDKYTYSNKILLLYDFFNYYFPLHLCYNLYSGSLPRNIYFKNFQVNRLLKFSLSISLSISLLIEFLLEKLPI